jgi:hypothetical protein
VVHTADLRLPWWLLLLIIGGSVLTAVALAVSITCFVLRSRRLEQQFSQVKGGHRMVQLVDDDVRVCRVLRNWLA